MNDINIRPVILAGGLGTRLHPRTLHLPKPLIPINGRPLLWYALNLINRVDIKRPIVSIAYLSNLIKAYFEREDVTFMEFTGCSMAETMIRISETDDSFVLLQMELDKLNH